ncbi:hypothetical protein [Rickettsiella endosymbiont of Dermanyssus gallinae]|uniref:hypothetical protein n=1 Tax=Rickettsiella endosymbiont of Dermanyssus gallinae TaxID=2856608 RepID=UPI001C5318A4|nr:hypothetical protein [Rickettsiella endosymbiont of Dermanyssus gallinae]
MGIQQKNSSLAALNEDDELKSKLSKLLGYLLNDPTIDEHIKALTANHNGYNPNFLDQITTKINVYKTIVYDKGRNFSLSSNDTTAIGLEAANIIFFIPYIGSALSIPIRPMLYALDRQRKLRRTRRKFFRLIKNADFLKLISILLTNTHQPEFSTQHRELDKARKLDEKIFREFWLCFKHQVRLDSPETEDTHKFKSFLEDFSSAAKKFYSKKSMAIFMPTSLVTLSIIGLIFFSPAALAFLPIALTSITQKLAIAGILLIPSLHFIEAAALLALKKILDLYEAVINKISPDNKKSPKQDEPESTRAIDLKKFWIDCLYNYHETLTPDLKQNFQESLDNLLQPLEKEKTLATAPMKSAMNKKSTLFQHDHRRSRAAKVKTPTKMADAPAVARQKTLHSNARNNSSFTHTQIKQPANRHGKYKKTFHASDLFRRPPTRATGGYSAEHPLTQCFAF